MRLRNVIRAAAVVGLASSLLVSCGSSDSRDRNVGTTELCTQGGACTVGEVGPAGGIVVFGAAEPGIDMWEVAPMNGYGTFDEAFALVDDLEFGGQTGWTLPNAAVIGHIKDALASFACAPDTDCGSEFGTGTYWSSDLDGDAHVVFTVDGTTATADAGSTHFFRPVRSFQMKSAETSTTIEEPTTTTEEPTTTTLPPTTTTTTILADAPCADGGPCVVGDTGPGGGVVFYVGESDFTSAGSDCGERCRYLEITKSDQSMGTPWVTAASVCYGDGSDAGRSVCTWNNSIYPGSMNQSAARVASEAIGMGMSNTNQIYSRMTTAGGVATNAYAAGVAWAYENNGKTDWFLPSKAELGEVYKQRGVIPGITVNTSQSASTYQSSTEVTAFNSWAQTISTGFGTSVNKTAGYRVRAIRAFGPRVVAFAVGTTTTTSTTTTSTTTTTTLPPTTTTTSTTTLPPTTTTSTTPVRVTASEAGRQLLATNSTASCVILTSGSVKCWGRNERGQLGNGQSGDDIVENKPVQVVGLDGSTPARTAVSMASRGSYHNCAVTAAASVVCWGYQYAGQLGDGVGGRGGTPRRATPAAVTGFDGSSFANSGAYVTTGEDTTCAIKLSGALFCWGDNRYGKAGVGSGDFVNTPRLVGGFDGSSPETRVTNVSLGVWFGCAVTEVGAVHCWGSNGSGQLGDGTTTGRSTPIQSASIDGSTAAKRAVAVSAGQSNACAVMANGSVACWGNADQGKFGDTSLRGNITTATPVRDIDGSAPAARAVSITTSSNHSCALMADGSMKCWGNSYYGQVGVGGTTSRPIVPRGLNGNAAKRKVRAISSSPYHTCALLQGNNVDCWGGTGALKQSSQQNPQEFDDEDD